MTDKSFHCKQCNYTTDRLYDYNKHKKTKTHLQNLCDIDTNENVFSCIKCNFYTTNKNNYNKHLLTQKHIVDSSEKKQHVCKHCEKQYSSKSNLWKHENKCTGSLKESSENNTSNEILVHFITQSKEIQNILIEQNKEYQKKTEELMKKTEEQSKQIMELTKAVSVTNNITNSNNNNTNKRIIRSSI